MTLGLAASASAQPPVVPAGEVAGFLAEATRVCAVRPAQSCVETGWSFADRDGDGALGLDEANAMRAGVQDWFLGVRDQLPERTTAGVAVGLLALQFVGVDTLHRSYDTNGDGELTPDEALADVTLDERPLPVLLQDRAAVDWSRFLERLGAGSALLGDLIPEAEAAE